MEKDYVKQAENVIKSLETQEKSDRKTGKSFRLTTSQIRNILSLSAEIYDIVKLRKNDEVLDDDLKDKLYALKVRIVYQSGRKQGNYYAVQEFQKNAHLLEEIDTIQTNNELLRFCRYLEALVAYKKFYDPNDK